MTPPATTGRLALSVVIPTRNPNQSQFDRVLRAIAAQERLPSDWELLILDNGSEPPVTVPTVAVPVRVIREPSPGLFHARRTALMHCRGEVVVFLDDDTAPAAGSLAAVLEFMRAHADVGVAGGRINPDFATPPPEWLETCAWALALRDWGDTPLHWRARAGDSLPPWSPIGAGLVVRNSAIPAYLAHATRYAAHIERLSWKGQGVGGTEDKDLVLCLLRAGWSMAYIPTHVIYHHIPAGRLEFAYFERLLPALQRLWMRTLVAHGFCQHAPVHPWTVPLRSLKAWFVFRAWRGPRERLTWQAARGGIAGLAAAYRDHFKYDLPTNQFAPAPPPPIPRCGASSPQSN